MDSSGVSLMPNMFRRRRSEPDAASPVPVSTGITCSVPGCSNGNAQPCAYRDRRGRLCQVASCLDHGVTLYGVPYCRRHGSTVQAIGELASDPNGRPDLNDRTPSLVNWISRDLDQHIRTLLEATAREGEKVLVDDAVRLSRDNNRNLRWERSWRLVEHTGLVLKVTIHVSEENDALVRINVGSEMVADGIPPWIARRRMGEDVDVAIDIAQRKLFYQYLEEAVANAVAEFRAGSDRPHAG
jgi:hypothetical protein